MDAGGSPRDVALDLAAGKLYWVHATSEGIQRSDFNGSNFETVREAGQFSGVTIAIDSSAGKLYWGGAGAVHRMNLDGSSPEFFVVADNGFIRQIDLDLVNQNIYWANEQFRFIARSGFGGNPNGEADIFQTGAGEPLDVKVDPINEVFYWTERTGVGSGAIRRFDFDGQNIVSIIPSILTDPRGLALGPAPGEAPPIPAVSTWGMCVIVLSILTAATVIFAGRRKRTVRCGRKARVL